MRLYIDPGTGSMLFTILIGVLSAAVYGLRNVFYKLRFILSGGKTDKRDDQRIGIAIFTDSKRYWNVFEPICDELEHRGQDAVYLTASPDDPALEKAKQYEHVKCEFVGEGNKAYARMNMLKADLVLSSTPGLDVYQWKRSRDVSWYVHIPHMATDVTLYRMFGLDYYDAILCSGEYQIEQVRKIEEKRGLPRKEMTLVGITYFDEMKARLDKLAGNVAKRDGINVLLAPSWGPSSIFNRFGADFIQRLIDTGYNIIIRPHPQSFVSEKELMDSLMAQFPESEKLEWNRDNDNFDVLSRSDIMISDFSGVIFDFSLVFDKPVIYVDAPFDDSVYDACWLDEKTWTFRTLPEIGKPLSEDSMDELPSMIEECLRENKYRDARKRARDESWAYPGEAAYRTVDYLISKRNEILRNKEKAE